MNKGAYDLPIKRPEAVDMNGRFQMQGGKNWFLPKEMNANQFFWDSHWLEIWSNHFYPSMGPNGGSVTMDSDDRSTGLRREQFKSVKSTYYLIPCAVSIGICINGLNSVGNLLNSCSWVMCYLERVWHGPLSPHCRRDWLSAWNLINLEITLFTCFQGFEKQLFVNLFHKFVFSFLTFYTCLHNAYA